MSRDLFGLKDEPFSAYPDNKYFFSSILHDKAITLLEYGLNSRKGFMLLTGLQGTGKTLTCNILKDSVKSCNVSMVKYEGENPDKLMVEICKGFGLQYTETDRQALFGHVMEFFVEEYKAGKNNLIIVDSAETISDDCLHMLSEFMEIEIEKCKLVQVIISGCPELHDRLRNIGGDLGPKFTFTVELAPLNLHDTIEYVEHRVKTAIGADDQHLFKSNSYSAIYDYSKGVPSEINRIAQKALTLAKDGKQSKITPKYIKMAAARLYGVKAAKRTNRKPLYAVVLIIALIGAGYFYKEEAAEFIAKKQTKTEQVAAVEEQPVLNVPPMETVEPPVTEETAPEESVVEPVEPVEAPAVEQPAEEPMVQAPVIPEPIIEEPVAEEPQTVETPEPQPAEPVETVQVDAPAIQHGCITANSGLKVRSGPSVDSELIGTAPSKAYIELLELSSDGNWWKTTFQGAEGYMFARYIKVVNSPEECN
jgi:general secretion pathway protein A